MKTINMEWMAPFVENPEKYQARLHENVLRVTDDVENKGYLLYRDLRKRMDNFITNAANCGVNYGILTALEHCITKDVCKYLSYKTLYRILFDDVRRQPVDIFAYRFIKNLYKQHLGITDDRTLRLAERSKLSGFCYYSPISNNHWYAIDPIWPKYMTIEDKDSFKKRKKKEAIAEQKRKAKEARQKKFEQEEGKVQWGAEEKQAFKSALEEKFGPLQKPDSESQNQIQNHENSKSDK
ncbi:MAG: hypothetical protein IJL21_00910 [Alphaproteobacteria bacterium]|nr:hypothetical protein [Alphaproteobacteria bacterium]